MLLQSGHDERNRLLMSTETLNQSGERIKESKRTLLETEELGVSILQDLHIQRQTLRHAQSTVGPYSLSWYCLSFQITLSYQYGFYRPVTVLHVEFCELQTDNHTALGSLHVYVGFLSQLYFSGYLSSYCSWCWIASVWKLDKDGLLWWCFGLSYKSNILVPKS
jgi:hypothetical protein